MINDNNYNSWPTIGSIAGIIVYIGISFQCAGSICPKYLRRVSINCALFAIITAAIWYVYGWSMGTGKDFGYFVSSSKSSTGKIIAYSNTAFTYAFVCIGTNIISCSNFESIETGAKIIYLAIYASVIFPIIFHWGWSTGWASPYRSIDYKGLLIGCGTLDVNLSGCLFLSSSTVSLILSLYLGPRKDRFSSVDPSTNKIIYTKNRNLYKYFGCILIFLGFWGLSAISSFLSSRSISSSKTGMGNTIVTGIVAGITSIFLHLAFGSHEKKTINSASVNSANNPNSQKNSSYIFSYINIDLTNYSLIAGAVAAGSGCSVFEPYAGLLIGVISSVLFYFTSMVTAQLQIDDTIEAIPLYFVNGLWSLLAPGFFAAPDKYTLIFPDYYKVERDVSGPSPSFQSRATTCAGIFYGGEGSQLLAQIIFCFAVLSWSCIISFLAIHMIACFMPIKTSTPDSPGRSVHPTPTDFPAGATAMSVSNTDKSSGRTKQSAFLARNGYNWDLVMCLPMEPMEHLKKVSPRLCWILTSHRSCDESV